MSNTIELTIDGLTHEGQGVARHNGKVVFVPNTAPGDQVAVKISSQKRKMASAEVVSWIQKSENHVQPSCRYFGKCGGCAQQHIHVPTQIAFKQQNLHRNLQRELGKELPEAIWQSPLVGDAWHYRHRVRLQRKGEALGFFANDSRKLVDISECLVIAEALNDAISKLRAVLSHLPKSLQEIAIDVDSNQQVAVVFYSKQALETSVTDKLAQWCAQHQIHGYVHSFKELLWQSEEAKPLMMQVNQMQVQYQPWQFSQTHIQLNQVMVAQALAWLELRADEKVADLFSGVGNFSLPMAAQAKQVIALEGLDELTQMCLSNAKANELNNVTAQTANLFAMGTWLEQIAECEKLLIDPPRAGAAWLCEQMDRVNASKMVYVSCNPATLARDAAKLAEQGFTLKKVCIMDMFTHTNHIESMALFERE